MKHDFGTTIHADDVKTVLDWCDIALRQCKHLGMSGNEKGAYVILREQTNKILEEEKKVEGQ